MTQPTALPPPAPPIANLLNQRQESGLRQIEEDNGMAHSLICAARDRIKDSESRGLGPIDLVLYNLLELAEEKLGELSMFSLVRAGQDSDQTGIPA